MPSDAPEAVAGPDYRIIAWRRAAPSLASEGRREKRQVSRPEPLPGATAPLDTTICTDCPRLGRERRAWRLRLRHALDAADEGSPDLQEDGQPCGRFSFSWVIRSSKVQFATSASRSMTRSASRSRSSC